MTVTPSGGTAPYTVSYTTPGNITETVTITGTSGDIVGLEAGIYTLTEINDGVCTETITCETAIITVVGGDKQIAR